MNRNAILAALCLALGIVESSQAAEPPKKSAITEGDANAAQQAWCDALVKIGKVHADGGDYKAVASQTITDLYDYDAGRVFFKPTLAHGKNTFRPTKAGPLAYFVGHDASFPDDSGFALKHLSLIHI